MALWHTFLSHSSDENTTESKTVIIRKGRFPFKIYVHTERQSYNDDVLRICYETMKNESWSFKLQTSAKFNIKNASGNYIALLIHLDYTSDTCQTANFYNFYFLVIYIYKHPNFLWETEISLLVYCYWHFVYDKVNFTQWNLWWTLL